MSASALVLDRDSSRVAGFDLLRGICALAVAAYHLLGWTHMAEPHTWGTYGVYIFFVLSGASMWIAYAEKFARGFSVARFLALRLIRLAPLYLLALAFVVLVQMRQGNDWAARAFLNLFFQFGLGNPGPSALVVGGWSLGIEFVFYLLFPVCLALLAARRWWLVLLLAFASQHVFIGSTLAGGTLAGRWGAYTQPLAFVFYFLAGCAIGRAMRAGKLQSHWLGLPLLVGCVAVIASASGSSIEETLVGPQGWALSVIAVACVAAASAARVGRFVAEQLGAASYGVYLLHPPLHDVLRHFAHGLNLVVLVVACSFAIALLLNHFYEERAQRWLKRISTGSPRRG